MGFSVIYSFRDAKGETSTTEINLPTSVTLADVGIFAGQMALLINPLITGVITRIGIAWTIALPAGLRAAPVAGSDIEEGGKFQFRTVNNFYTRSRIPTFDEAKIVAGTNEIDQTDADVAAFVTAMVGGLDLSLEGGSADVQPSDSRDEDIVALDFARENFVSSRN